VLVGERDRADRADGVDVLAHAAAARGRHVALRDPAALGEHQPGLLLELAGQRTHDLLAAVDLAAGELPHAGHRVPGGAADEQHAAVGGLDEGTGDRELDSVAREGRHACVIGRDTLEPER